MRQGRPGIAAAALALAALVLVPGPAAGASLDVSEKETAALEARLAQVEKVYTRPDETSAARARRQFSDGETQFLLGDWLHASILVYGALDEPGFRAGPDAPRALLYLGDSLRSQGYCGAALATYDELRRLTAPDLQLAALIGTLDCRIKLKRLDGVQPVLDAAQLLPGGGPSAELAYLAGKAAYFRTDLRPAERLERGVVAFGAVPAPLHLAATYFQGALHVEAGDLPAAIERFETCLALPGDDPKQVEIREYCALAAGRVYAAQEKFVESLDRYQLIPYTSPRFNEALYEVAWGYVRGGNHEQALRTAAMIVDLAPDSQMVPEATILTGHLSLRLGRYVAAGEAFNKVVNDYAPVRDEIDAILTMHDEPVRYFNELISKQGKAFDAASVLPPIAAKWASAQQDVGGALDLVQALDAARQDLADSLGVIGRLEALLARGGGLDAAPLARDGWINADAIENATMRARGRIAERADDLAGPRLGADNRTELERLRQARGALQARLDTLPQDPNEVERHARRMRGRVDQAEKAAFQLGMQIDAAGASVAGIETWLNEHRSEPLTGPAGRAEFATELRSHRDFVTSYNESLRALRLEVAEARDAVGGSAQAAGDAGLRHEYLALLEQERALVRAAGPVLAPAEAEELSRGEALLARLDQTDAAAERLKERFAEAAVRRAATVGEWLAAERAGLVEQQALLATVSGEAGDIIGRIALRSFGAVRAQFYRLVLKAEVGLVDVAWSRKRERVEKIQQISRQKADELQALDRDYKRILRGEE